jgi:arsenite methyltransferase
VETETRIRQAIRDTYSKVASGKSTDCGCSRNSATEGEIRSEAESLRAGCGHPVTEADIRSGEVVLDLGSGAGADAFQAAKLVGPAGKVIGIDATPEMIWKARNLAAKESIGNVEFRLGEIEHMPIEADTIDVAISNCVLNLLPDKLTGFREILRILKPGGRIRISDLVTSSPVPKSQIRAETWAACVEGAITETEYLQLLEEAGFQNVRAVHESGCTQGCCTTSGPELRSVAITGVKSALRWSGEFSHGSLRQTDL